MSLAEPVSMAPPSNIASFPDPVQVTHIPGLYSENTAVSQIKSTDRSPDEMRLSLYNLIDGNYTSKMTSSFLRLRHKNYGCKGWMILANTQASGPVSYIVSL